MGVARLGASLGRGVMALGARRKTRRWHASFPPGLMCKLPTPPPFFLPPSLSFHLPSRPVPPFDFATTPSLWASHLASGPPFSCVFIEGP